MEAVLDAPPVRAPAKPKAIPQPEQQPPLGITERETNMAKAARTTVEAGGLQWHVIERGNRQSDNVIFDFHGWLGRSATGNDRLARTFAGEVVNSPGLEELTKNSPESATKMSERIKRLEGKYRVITPELPGFGITESLDGEASLDRIVDALKQLQDIYGVDKVTIFGSSMGAILGAKYAAKYKDRVNAFVAEGMMTQPKDMKTIAYTLGQIATIPRVAQFLDEHKLAKPLFKLIVSGSKDFKMNDPYAQEQIIADSMRGDTKTAASTLHEIGHDIGPTLAQIECPVLVLDGAHGDLVPIMRSNNVARDRLYPDLSMEEKAPSKVAFIPIGGLAGEHGHNIVNTFPEGMVSWVDYILNKWNTNKIS